MEGFSLITYRDKTILYYNFSIFQPDPDQKKKIIALLEYGDAEWFKRPTNSVLALFNLTNLRFDMDLFDYVQESAVKTASYEKKMAFVGVNGLAKTVFNLAIGFTSKQNRRLFNTEEEAKEWLVKED